MMGMKCQLVDGLVVHIFTLHLKVSNLYGAASE